MNLTLRINNHMLIGWNDLELLRNELNLLWHHDTLIRWRIAVWRAENVIPSTVRNVGCIESTISRKFWLFKIDYFPRILIFLNNRFPKMSDVSNWWYPENFDTSKPKISQKYWCNPLFEMSDASNEKYPENLDFSKSYLPLLLFGSTVWTIVNCGCCGGCVITKIDNVRTLVLRNSYCAPVWIAPVVGSCICITCCITKGWTPPLAIVPFTIIWVPPDVGMSICCGWAKNEILSLRNNYVTQ